MLQELRNIDRLIAEGDLMAAQAACRSLLQQYPTSAEVHEKMGDIMYRRELWEDAVAWYDLASQLAETPELTGKLAEARKRMRHARTGPEPELVDDTGSGRKLVWLGIGTAVMALVVIAIIAGLFGGPGERGQTSTTPVVSDVSEGAPTRAPALTGPSPVRSAHAAPAVGRTPAATGGAQEVASGHWSAQPLPPQRAPRRVISSRSGRETTTEPLTDHDRAVIEAVSSLTWGDERSMSGRVSAMVDPYTGYAVVRATIPRSLPSAGLVEAAVKQAYRIALATIQADEVVKTMTIQLVRVTPSGERVLAFRGNTTRTALRGLGNQAPDFSTLWNEIFKTVWWNPQADGALPTGFDNTPAQAAATTD